MARVLQWDFWLWSLAVFAVILNAALGNHNIDSMVATDRRVTHTRTVQMEFKAILSNIIDAETGNRGYLLSGRKDFLEPFHTTGASYRVHIENLKTLTVDMSRQRERTLILNELIDAKFLEMHRIRSIRDRSGIEAAAREMSNERGKAVMDQIRETIEAASEEESNRLERRISQAKDQIWFARVATFAAAGLATAIILIAATFIRKELQRRLYANQSLREVNEQLEIAYATLQESETRFHDLAEHLEQKVQQRTADLIQQTGLLKASNAELETFASIASHDLQEPLRKIQSFGSQLLKKHQLHLDAEGQDSVHRMVDAATRMRQLIEDLLAYGRVNTPLIPFEEVNLNAVLTEVLSTLDVRLEQCGGMVTVDPLPTVLGDESQLRQLFQNLLGNAIKFAKSDEPPSIQISALAYADLPEDAVPPKPEGVGWRISICDNGIGFEQQYSNRIFELFQRLHGRHKYEGTGLGLAICKKIAQRHGVDLQVRSSLGIGTTFILDWPQQTRRD